MSIEAKNMSYRTYKLSALFSVFLCLLFLMPFATPANANTGVGFVPSSGVWFSQDVFYENETVKLYTVVVNNTYKSLSGIIGFYDNDQLIVETVFSNIRFL